MFGETLYLLSEINYKTKSTTLLSAKFSLDFKQEVAERLALLTPNKKDLLSLRYEVEVYENGRNTEIHYFDYASGEFAQLKTTFDTTR